MILPTAYSDPRFPPMQDRHQGISLFSVRTGKKLHSIQLPPSRNLVTCIKFSRTRSTTAPESSLRAQDNEPPSLLASAGGRLTEWSCQGNEWIDDGEADDQCGSECRTGRSLCI